MHLQSVRLKSYLAVSLLLLAGDAANAQVKDLLDRVPIIGDKDKQAAEQLVADTMDEAAPMSASQEKHLCDLPAADSGKVGLGQQIKANTVRMALSSVSKGLNVEGIELPEKIQSPCYAEVRWDYVERKTAFWTDKVVDATNKALTALDIDHQIEADRLFSDGADDETPGRSDFVSARKELDKGFELLEQGMAEKGAVNEVLLAEARGAMRGAMTYGAEIIGWDQRLVEFMGDNMRWTVNRAPRVRNFEAHAKLVGGTFRSIQNVSAAVRASEADEVLLETASKAEEERIAQENAAFEEQLRTELDL